MKTRFTLIFLLVLGLPMQAERINDFFRESGNQSALCSDEVFLRRAYIASTGRLPKIEQTVRFLQSGDTDKRTKLVDSLLSTTDYLTYFGNLWGDMLRIKSEFPSNLWPNGVQAYNRWVHEKLVANTPYDKMVQELLLSQGSNFRTPEVNFFRAFAKKTPDNIYKNIQLVFLGNRNPDKTGQIFFSQIRYKSTKEWKEEIIYIDYHQKPSIESVTINGESFPLQAETDWRKPWVNWLTAHTNTRFAEVMVNRLWYWIMGQGLVNEPDDWRTDNPPINKPLMNYLTHRFIESGYDMKGMLREILLSYPFQAAQYSKETFKSNRLSAEVIVDAISDLTGIADTYSSRIPEPFSFFPEGMHADELGDASVSSSTLELFGRASRDVSLENQRNKELNTKQLLYLMNSSELESKIRKSKSFSQLISTCKSADEICNKVTLSILSRYPTDKEINLFRTHAQQNSLSNEQLCYDMVWTQLNSVEFLYNH